MKNEIKQSEKLKKSKHFLRAGIKVFLIAVKGAENFTLAKKDFLVFLL